MISAAAWLILPALALSVPRPNPARGPAEVIRLVAGALQNNDSPAPNAGVFTAYQFASPGNRAVTGPYGRFLRIVKSQESRPLFGRHAEEFGELAIHGDEAEQDVRVYPDNGPAVTYRFLLSRQTTSDCAGCWLINGVVRVR